MSLYFSLVHSYLNYWTCVWGNANDIHLNKIRVLQNKVVRIISDVEYNAHSIPHFKELKILNFDNILKMQLACLMFEYDHGNLPICFNTLFNKMSSIHSYGTRNATAGKLSENVAVNTTTHGSNCTYYIYNVCICMYVCMYITYVYVYIYVYLYMCYDHQNRCVF